MHGRQVLELPKNLISNNIVGHSNNRIPSPTKWLSERNEKDLFVKDKYNSSDEDIVKVVWQTYKINQQK